MFQVYCVDSGTKSAPPKAPVFAIGELQYKVDDALRTVLVTATMSRANSLKAVGGYHIALATQPSLTWAEGVEKGFFASSLLLVFEQNARATLRALLPHLSDEELAELAYSIGGNTEHTANRDDIHAHVPFASKSVWRRKVVRRMVDDARSPSEIARVTLRLAGLNDDKVEEVINELYPPASKK